MPKPKFRFKTLIPLILEHEGGNKYVQDPVDPGGNTKYGISQRAYPDENIKKLTLKRAKEIYLKDYWEAGKVEELPQHLRYIYFDMCVNQGIFRAVKILQQALNRKGAKLKVDGGIGPKTIAAAHQKYMGKHVEVERVRSYRVKHYAHLVEQRPALEKYWYGWYKRALCV